MKGKGLWIVLGLIALVPLWGFSGYNGMVNADERINGAWGQIDTTLQRRADLIPNLVETVKGYAAHETQVFQAVSDARARLAGAQTLADRGRVEGELSSALSRLLAIAESYPQLKADANFRQLQDELAGTENRIAAARRDYNEAVQQYRARIRRFPNNILAGLFSFGPRDYFQAEAGTQSVPKVKF